MDIRSMADLDLSGKRVVIRVDFNVPLDGDVIVNDNRLQASLPTIQLALDARAKVLILSHLGKPTEGKFDARFSLRPVAKWLSKHLGFEVPLVRDWLQGVEIEPGRAVLAENVRFIPGEKENDEQLARRIAALSDVYVMDAFATAHRAQASTCGAIYFAPVACGGLLLMEELAALGAIFEHPREPLLAIAAGSKVSTKLALLNNLIGKVRTLLVGGGIANTFLKSQGLSVGCSLCEDELVVKAAEIVEEARKRGTDIPLPVDLVVAKEISELAVPVVKNASTIEQDDIILDVGPATVRQWSELITTSGTVVWNGPVGMCELEAFRGGTRALAGAVESSGAFSVLGGGDTVAAIELCGFKKQNFSYVSTAGGAFMEYLQGSKLPAVEALKSRGVR